MTSHQVQDHYDVVVVGGGHNGLVGATYLAQAGLSVLALERVSHVGGAATSSQPFPGMAARMSRFASLVGLLPDQIVSDLGLAVDLRARRCSSFTPVAKDHTYSGLLVERPAGPPTLESFEAFTGSRAEFDAWCAFYDEIFEFTEVVAPTMLEPLRTAREIQAMTDAATWEFLVERPLGEIIEKRFEDDTLRGMVAADAVVGTFASLQDPALRQNRTFLYQVMGNGSGQWKLPVGGMGTLTQALTDVCREAGVTVLTDAGVSAIDSDGVTAQTTWHGEGTWHSVDSDWVLSNVAPWVLQVLLGGEPGERPEGSQLKVDLLLEGLPTLRSGVRPREAFSGTMRVAEGYEQLQVAFDEAAVGAVPTTMPCEVYCHSLGDASVLGPLAPRGFHTLTILGVHTPARLFDNDLAAARDLAVERTLDAINEHLVEPIESLIAVDENGEPCLQAQAPQDVDDALAMPGGHMYHGDLSWPWSSNRARLETPAQRWGVATEVANVLLCGAGATRGGSVSGIGGHNAAQAVLESRRA